MDKVRKFKVIEAKTISAPKIGQIINPLSYTSHSGIPYLEIATVSDKDVYLKIGASSTITRFTEESLETYIDIFQQLLSHFKGETNAE